MNHHGWRQYISCGTSGIIQNQGINNNHAMYDHSDQGLGNLADSRDLAVTTSGNIRQIFRLLGISVKRKQFELPWYHHPGFTEFQYFHFLLILLFD